MELEKLPNEVLAEIAIQLDSDQDLVNLLLVCKTLRTAIDHPCSNIWRTRYRRYFDLPNGLDTLSVYKQYTLHRRLVQVRHRITKAKKRELFFQCLKSMVDLIKDAYQGVLPTQRSKNITVVVAFVEGVPSFVNTILDPELKSCEFATTSLMHMALFHVVIEQSFKYPRVPHLWSLLLQRCFGHPNDHPLIETGDQGRLHKVNIMCLIDFFRTILTHPFWDHYPAFSQLERAQRPQAWDCALNNDLKPLGKYWRGASTWFEDGQFVVECRRGTKRGLINQLGCDPNVGPLRDGLTFLSLDFEPSHQPAWTQELEWFTESIPSAELMAILRQGGILREGERPIAGKDYLPFVGQDSDMQQYIVAGNMHSLPPQDGLVGFRRINFVKYPRPPHLPDFELPPIFTKDGDLVDDHRQRTRSEPFPHGAQSAHIPPPDLGAIDLHEDCWLYDGVVLPGGKAMLGRWYRCYEDALDPIAVGCVGDKEHWFEMWKCGPFLYWCID